MTGPLAKRSRALKPARDPRQPQDQNHATPSRAPLRVAFHAINGVGLGHLVRAMCIAKEVLAVAPGSQVLVLTNARDPAMLVAEGIDFIRFPPRLAEPHADPWRVETALPEDEETAAFEAAFGAFMPDVVVFDTHAPPRLVAHATLLGARPVLVLRELRPEALSALLASGALGAFERVVVPHEVGEVDVGALEAAGLSVRVVGPVVRPVTAGSGAPRAKRAGPRVVALAGGGGQPVDARRYVRAVADAHLLARARVPTLETVLVTGPYGARPSDLEGFPGLTVLAGLPDLGPLLASASLVVSQCGYNAVAELRALRKPAVLVPAYRKSEDQSARARRLARVGAAVLARPEARSIASEVEALLTTPGALDAMRASHARAPLVAGNRAAAEAVLSPVLRPAGPVRRVVLVAHDLAPRLGGMETVARALARALSARGVHVRVYTTRRLGADDPRATGLPEGVVVPLFRPRPRPGRIDLEADLLATLEQALRDEPDVVHLCHAGLAPWVPSLQAALPVVVTVSVHGNDLLAPWVHHSESEEAYGFKQIAGLRAAAGVLAVSEFSASLARARGVSAVQVLHNGVDVTRFAPRPAGPRGPRERALAVRLGLEPTDEVVLTVARLAPRKGHATAIRAVALLARERPRLRFVYTGASEVMRAELGALAAELGVPSRVIAAGRVSEDELPVLYRLADVFALLADEATASDVEGFGVALLEAAASGVPQVASRSGGIPEAVEDGRTGLLVPAGDPAAAARALARVLGEPRLAAALGARSRARVVTSFSEARACERVLGAWTAAAATPLRTPAPASLSASLSGARLAKAARDRATALRRERATRLVAFQAAVTRERGIRVRATGEGDRLLPEVLADCASLGHRPTVEVKLRRFVEADFQAHALPLVDVVEVAHGVPFAGARALHDALRGLPGASLARVRVARLFLTPEARASAALTVSAVPEVHALRRFFSELGATVVPPPELMRYLSTVPAGGPETGMIEPTNLCNLACPTCPTGTGKIKPLPQMTLRAFEGVLAQLAPRLRNLALWNYGEPLLNRELPGMIAHAKAAGVGVVKVSSNVHFLDGARGEALLRSGLDVLILSVDGASQATYQTFRKDGEFDHVARSVAWLCAEKKRLGLAKPRIELQFIAMRHNEHELPEMRRLARQWGVDTLRVKTVGADDDTSRGLVPATRLLSRYAADGVTPNTRHAFCTMAWDHTVVNVDGSVTPCCYLRPDMGPEFVMGNVFDAPFLSIWRGERYRRFREAMLEGRGAMPVCRTCRGGTHDLLAAVEAVDPS